MIINSNFMKNILSLFLLLICTSLVAINPTTNPELLNQFNSGSDNIDTELNQLNEMNNLVINNQYDFDALNANHSEMVAATKLSNKAASGLFEGHPDNPLGIPGFWWGFCLGWVGMLIMYLTMDEGSARKEQVKNALYGCIILNVLALVLWFGLIASAAT